MFSKKFLSGAALTALSFSMAGVAHAQSSGSQAAEEEMIVVTGARERRVRGDEHDEEDGDGSERARPAACHSGVSDGGAPPVCTVPGGATADQRTQTP